MRKKLSAGAQLSAMRKRHAKVCEHCGTKFTALNPIAKYCGNTCKCMAYRQRKADGLVKSIKKRVVKTKRKLAKVTGKRRVVK